MSQTWKVELNMREGVSEEMGRYGSVECGKIREGGRGLRSGKWAEAVDVERGREQWGR